MSLCEDGDAELQRVTIHPGYMQEVGDHRPSPREPFAERPALTVNQAALSYPCAMVG